MYFHVRLILHDLRIFLPHENGFSRVKNAYIKSAYYSICNDIDIERYEGVLEHALSKVDFSVGTSIYILPSNLNLNIGKILVKF